MNSIPYSYLKTIDGEDIRTYSKQDFEAILPKISTRKSQTNDRILFFINELTMIDGLRLFRDDYFEIPTK